MTGNREGEHACPQQRSVVLQLSRLMAYPMVRDAVETDRLAVHGWHYIIETGEVLILDVDRGASRRCSSRD